MMWYYFGCRQGNDGHYLCSEGGHGAHGRHNSIERALGNFDGSLAPYPESSDLLYKAAVTRLGGLGYTALAWWDRSQDSRGASNSIVFAPSLTIEPADMLDAAYGKFPWVFARLPKPLHLFVPASPSQPTGIDTQEAANG